MIAMSLQTYGLIDFSSDLPLILMLLLIDFYHKTDKMETFYCNQNSKALVKHRIPVYSQIN